MSISKRRLRDGTTVYDVREYVGFTLDDKRDRKSVTCRTLRAAKAEQAKLIAMRDSRRGRSGRCTFSDYVDRWWWPSTASLAASTRDTYEKELRLRLRPAFGETDIRDITRPMVQRMVDVCGTKRVAEKALGTLRTILNQAVGDGLIQSNPASARYVMPNPGRKRDNGIVIGTYEAMGPLLAALRDYTHAWTAASALCSAPWGFWQASGPRSDTALTGLTLTRKAAPSTCAAHTSARHLARVGTTSSARRLSCLSAWCRCRVRSRTSSTRYRSRTKARCSRERMEGACPPPTAKRHWTAFLRWCSDEGRDVPHATIENRRRHGRWSGQRDSRPFQFDR
jgi:hypothetical protein